MKIPLVDLKAGYEPIKNDVLQAISTVFDGMQLFLGPNINEFEREFASFNGSKYCATVANGTDAILIALKALGVGQGDEVITTSHTFFATIEAIVLSGAKPVFADIHPMTYCINPDLIAEKITPGTKAIIPVHLYGHPCDMDKIMEIARRHDLFVIEDTAQAHGALYNGKKCGTFGNMGSFSFYYTKNLGCYGEGGGIITDNEDAFNYSKLFRNHGQQTKYEHMIVGTNNRIDEIQAAILRIKLKFLDEMNAKRRQIAKKYNELLKETPLILPEERDGCSHVFHLYVIRSKHRDELQKFLSDAGIGTGIHYKIPAHLQRACDNLNYKKGDLPVTEQVCDEILSLPIYPELKDEQIEHIASKIKEFYKKV